MAKKGSNDVTLKFAHHQQLIYEGILRLFDSKCLLDVTIECKGSVVEAHKLLLGIFCPVLFDNLNNEQLCQSKSHLNVDFACDQLQHLSYLIEFLYRGQVTLPQLHLQDLYEAAEKLGIQGLIDAIKKVKGKYQILQTQSETEPEAEELNSEKETFDFDKELVEATNKNKKRKTESKSSKEGESDELSSDLDIKSDTNAVPSTKSHIGLRNRLVNRSKQSISRVAYKKKWRQTRPIMKCSYCDYETRDKYTFKSHLAKHDPTVGGFVCEVCSKTFRSKRGFRCHLRGHQDPGELFNCTHCSFYTPQKWSWLQHLAVIHKVDPEGNPLTETVRCSECDYVCVANHQLKAHIIRKHTADKPFKCSECNYAAVIRYELDKHTSIVHRKERPFMCETCGFRSQTQSGFERHKRSHSGIKPFKCEICGQEYADNRKFKTHLLRHVNDEKPYVCHLCGHSCRRRDNLQMHLKRIHKTTMECEAELHHSTNTPDSAASESAAAAPNACLIPNTIANFPMVSFFEVKDSFISTKSTSPQEQSVQPASSLPSPKHNSVQM